MKWDEGGPARNRLFYRSREHQAACFEAALEHAGSLGGKSVLDVGCGYGDLIAYLPAIGRYKGIDVDGDAIDRARIEHPGYRFSCTGKATRADVVLAIGTLQACSDGRRALRSWVRAAGERLVVVSCVEEKLKQEQRDADWWAGIPHERYESDDDFFVAVVLSAS